MRILLVKTSSLGDVIHNLPVASDLKRQFPDAAIDWCVEEAFADIPRLHPGVGEIIPVALRRWRKALASAATWREIGAARRRLGGEAYDVVLDTQGLVKSGLIACLARGRCYGYAAEAAREPLASWFYDRTFVIPPNVHAVERNRWLSAAAFDYPVDLPLDYGIAPPDPAFPWLPDGPYAVLLTATSRDEKLWHEERWIAVARHLHGLGLMPVLPWGSVGERRRAERIAAAVDGAVVAPALPLSELAALIGHAGLAVGVDTGLVHLAAALGVPVIAIHVATDPARTGVLGARNFRNLGGPGRAPAAHEVLAAVDRGLNPPGFA
ncbi:MAG: lipopolysaccharide heptosyltransferase I [Candidatus Accumulibacter sp.]|jgi:heptosyltransferase-1|nr:lipopolysaccharide heptosyltransferase I [Accumulibacter sp.]